MQHRRVRRHGLDCGGHVGERLVIDHDRVERLLGSEFVDCRHRRHGVADITHAVQRDQRPVAQVQAPVHVHPGEVGTREHRDHAGHGQRSRNVDARDARVGQRAAQDAAVQHARHDHVARELRRAGHLIEVVAADLAGVVQVFRRIHGGAGIDG